MAAGDSRGVRPGPRLSAADQVTLDEAIRKAEQLSRVEFSVFIGDAHDDPRAYALSLHRSLVAPARSVLILVDPNARAVEVVTGSQVRRSLSDARVELAIAEMQSHFVHGELVGGLRRGIQMLAEHARTARPLRPRQEQP